ncbi:MAG: U32 family peptidase [Clostridia bacterium]|nr:U32 family peptidase [Clostridia bacterium]
MKNKIELLAPAGGYEQFIAAVESGADAVYLGGASFNARHSAANFSDEDIKKVVEYAHVRNVKIHLTLNTLVHDDELPAVLEFAKKMYSYGVDAFIIQDLGVAHELKKMIPEAEIHFSTQGTIYQTSGVEFGKSLGFKRVVLSRELSLDEIEEICRSTDTEIEVFVHGALCICYSGQCRLSSLIGERSGNRGKCAQPCRLPYALCEGERELTKDSTRDCLSYIMSPKDMCGIHDLVRLIKIGVRSLKIEGRLKSPEYVACVTSIYRKYIDLAYDLIEKGKEARYHVAEEDVEKLKQVFNRGGFSNGYYEKKLGKDLICRTRPKHWGTYLGKVVAYQPQRALVTVKLAQDIAEGDGIEVVHEGLPGNIVTYLEKDGKQVKSACAGDVVKLGDIRGTIKAGEEVYKISDKKLNAELKKVTDGKFYKKVPIGVEVKVELTQPISAEFYDFDGHRVVTRSEFVAIEAVNKAIREEDIAKAFGKLGDTPFSLSECKVEINGNCLVPVSVLNQLRREGCEELYQKRAFSVKELPSANLQKLSIAEKKREGKISVYLYRASDLEGLELADRIYLPLKEYSEEIRLRFPEKEVVPYLTAVSLRKQIKIDSDSVLIGNPGQLELVRDCKNIYADMSFNVFHSYTAELLKEYGIKGVNLSFELNLEEMKKIETDLEKEVTVYGRLPLMISEHCPIGSEIAGKFHCGLCQKKDYTLKDRTGEKFPILTDPEVCRIQLLNSKILFAPEVCGYLKEEVDYFRVYFFEETKEEREKILRQVKVGKKTETFGYTSGHFYRGV